jgi:hypothetical protein
VRGDVGGQVTTILNALADLAPSSEQRSNDPSIPLEWFRWLSAASVRLLAPEAFLDPLGPSYQPSTQRVAPIDRDFAERLAAIDQIRPGQRPLRVGWLFVAGRIELEDGRTRGVFHPLVSVPVRVVRPPAFGQATLVPAGDVTISDLVVDLDERNRLEGQIEYGGGGLDDVSDVAIPDALLGRLPRLQRFARAVAAAGSLPGRGPTPCPRSPRRSGDLLEVPAPTRSWSARRATTIGVGTPPVTSPLGDGEDHDVDTPQHKTDGDNVEPESPQALRRSGLRRHASGHHGAIQAVPAEPPGRTDDDGEGAACDPSPPHGRVLPGHRGCRSPTKGAEATDARTAMAGRASIRCDL